MLAAAALVAGRPAPDKPPRSWRGAIESAFFDPGGDVNERTTAAVR